MVKREKRLIKQKEGLLEQVQKHLQKLETEVGRKDTTHEYWEKEIARFKQRIKQRDVLLRRKKR